MMEEVASTDELFLHARTAMLGPNVDIKQFSRVMQELADDITAIREYRRYALYYAKEAEMRRQRVGENLWKAFEQMQKDGTIEAFRKAAEAAEREIHKDDP